MNCKVREFKCVKNTQAGDETEASSVSVFYELDQATRIYCSIDGPMQKQMSGESTSEGCQVKVNIEFINNFESGAQAILNQFPDEKEYLEQVCASMPSEAAANHEREQRVKFLTNGVVVQTLQKLLQAVILGYEGTQISVNFTVVECNQDLMQALVNTASFALLSSNLRMKCVPAAICVLSSAHLEEVCTDPTLQEIQAMRQKFSHKCFAVVDAQKQEFLYSKIEPLDWSSIEADKSSNENALTLSQVSKLMGICQSAAAKVQEILTA